MGTAGLRLARVECRSRNAVPVLPAFDLPPTLAEDRWHMRRCNGPTVSIWASRSFVGLSEWNLSQFARVGAFDAVFPGSLLPMTGVRFE